MNINGISMPDYAALWGKKKTQRNITETAFTNRMAELNETDADSQTSDRTNEKRATDETAFRQDTKTESEIIVKPDGSRVLMITVNIGGTQASMSLQISEPTDMQNNISKQENRNSEAPVNTAALTSDEISGSVSEE